MNKTQLQAQKANMKVIGEFFKAHTGPKYYFDLLAYCPANASIPASNMELPTLESATQKAFECSIMTTGWVIRASVVSIPIYGGTRTDILTLRTIHPKHLNMQVPTISHEVQILAQSAACRHGQPLRFDLENGWPVCVDCGTDMDDAARADEYATEAAQNERLYN